MKEERKASGRRVGFRAAEGEEGERRAFQGVWLGAAGWGWRVRKGSVMERRCSLMKGILPWNCLSEGGVLDFRSVWFCV